MLLKLQSWSPTRFHMSRVQGLFLLQKNLRLWMSITTHLQLAEIGLIDSNYSARNDELIFENVDTSPIRGIYDPSKGVLSLLGYATTEAYITAIRSIKYNYQLTLDNNGNQTPISTAPKRVYFRVSDGQLASDTPNGPNGPLNSEHLLS